MSRARRPSPLLVLFSGIGRRRFSHSPTSLPPPQPLRTSAALTADEVDEIHRLVPSLCDAGHHADAVRLLNAALLADPPPLASLPVALLSDRLAELPDMTATMSLLTALRYHPRRPSPLPFCSALLSSYFRLRRHKEAGKVFFWLLRPDSPRRPDADVYRAAISGLCKLCRTAEALRALREMVVGDRMPPGAEIREAIYRGLLREAYVDEARELDAALKAVDEGANDGVDLVDRVLEKIIGALKE